MNRKHRSGMGLEPRGAIQLLLCAAFWSLVPACHETTVVASTGAGQVSSEEEPPGGRAPEDLIDPAAGPPRCVVYVDSRSTSPSKDGQSWGTALTSIQEGIAGAATQAPCAVWVAEGIYNPGDAREDSFRLAPDVSLYGGFGGGETEFGQRDWKAHATTLDGRGIAYHVVTGSEGGLLDGFRVVNGKADGLEDSGKGGGMINLGCSPRVSRCEFRDNSAWARGGAIHNRGGSPALSQCTFSNNQTSGKGGALSNEGASPRVSACLFQDNSAVDVGGAISNENGSPRLENTLLINNRTSLSAGAGMASEQNSRPKVINCTFSGNWALLPGGAMKVSPDSEVTVVNSVLWNNLPMEFNLLELLQIHVTYSDLQSPILGTGNFSSDPQLNVFDLYKPYAGSPCIDAADGDQAPPRDHLGQQRADDPAMPNKGVGTVPYADVGALEFLPP